MRCVASQRLVGYAKNANPPYIWLKLGPLIPLPNFLEVICPRKRLRGALKIQILETL